MDLPTTTLIAITAFFAMAYTAQAITGFGSTVVSITLSALLLPAAFVTPIAVALNLPFCGYLVWRNQADIDGRLLRQQVLPFMAVGTALGALAAWWLQAVDIRKPLGVLVLGLVILDVWRLWREHQPPLHRGKQAVFIGVAGLAQGFAASGGPLLAAALAGARLPKSMLRASLSVVWLITNSAMTLGYVLTDRYSAPQAQLTLWLLPVTFAALWLGNWLHHRVSERQFRLSVDACLLLAALALVFA